jgi:hypothetical protein
LAAVGFVLGIVFWAASAVLILRSPESGRDDLTNSGWVILLTFPAGLLVGVWVVALALGRALRRGRGGDGS